MSSWFSRFLRNGGSKAADRTASEPEPSPFEWTRSEGPFKGSLYRPIVYAFEHIVLPRALFMAHPELTKALSLPKPSGSDFVHFWSSSLAHCTDGGLLVNIQDESLEDLIAFWEYAGPLMESMTCEETIAGDFDVHLLSTPTPKSEGETHFVAMCRKIGEVKAYDGQSSRVRRYFTLEKTFETQEMVLCEWSPEGRHINYGLVPIQDPRSFAALLELRLKHTEASQETPPK